MTTIHDYNETATVLTSLKQLNQTQVKKSCNHCRSNQYELLDNVQSLYSPLKTQQLCSKSAIQGGSQPASILMYATKDKVGLSGVYRCHSHLCPVCTDKRNKPNRDRLEEYIAKSLDNEHEVYFCTFTIPRGNDISGQHKSLGDLYKSLNKELRRKGLEFVSVKSFDYTFSLSKKRGQFFPHLHMIYMFKPIKGYEHLKEKMSKIFRELWTRISRKMKIETAMEAQDIQKVTVEDDIAEISNYVTKTSKTAENLSYEIVSKRKTAKHRDSFTWFEVMELIASGDDRYVNIYRDFINFHKGKRTISWSIGIEEYFAHMSRKPKPKEEEEDIESVSLEISEALLYMFSITRTRGLALRCLQGTLLDKYNVSSVILKAMSERSIHLRNELKSNQQSVDQLQEIFGFWLQTVREEDKILKTTIKGVHNG